MFCFVAKTAFPVLTNSATCIGNNIETILVYFFCIIRSIEKQQIFHCKTSSWAVFLLLSVVALPKILRQTILFSKRPLNISTVSR